MKTLITIDFDGCISPIDSSRDFKIDKDFIVMKLAGFSCAIHKDVLKFLQELNDHENVKVNWASSWNAATEDFFKNSKGLIPNFDWLDVSAGKPEAITEKFNSEKFEKFVAIEDSLKVTNKLKRLTADLTTTDRLIINPRLKTGLTSLHIKKIKEFLNN